MATIQPGDLVRYYHASAREHLGLVVAASSGTMSVKSGPGEDRGRSKEKVGLHLYDVLWDKVPSYLTGFRAEGQPLLTRHIPEYLLVIRFKTDAGTVPECDR